MPRNEQVKRRRNPIVYMEYWKIKFDCGMGTTPERIFWVIEKDLPGDGMELTKDPSPKDEHQEPSCLPRGRGTVDSVFSFP